MIRGNRGLRSFVCIGILFVWFAPCLLAAQVGKLTKQPYLQNATQTAMTIMWECSGEDAVLSEAEAKEKRSIWYAKTDEVKGVVRYGKDKALGQEVPASVVKVRYIDEPKGKPKAGAVKTAYLFTCQLQGLEPGATYHYQVASGPAESAVFHFRTVPAKVDAFTFVGFTDSHAGQYGVLAKVRDLMMKKEKDIDFIIHQGDLINSGEAIYSEWGGLFQGAEGLLDHIPFWPTVGNHDGYGKWESYCQVFSLPDKEVYYSFDYGNAHFVSLCSYAGKLGPDMLKWCEQDLAQSKAFWKIVFLHEPAFAAGCYSAKWGWKDYIPLFEKYGVNLYLCGHLHIYQRFHPLYLPGSKPASAITYIVNGESGGKLREAYPRPEIAHAAAKVSTYTVFRIEGTKLSARVVGLGDKVIDEFAIQRKPDGTYDDAYLANARNARGLVLREVFPNKGYTDTVPTADAPAEVYFGIYACGMGLKEAIKLKVSVADECQSHYVMQPEVVEVALDPTKVLTLRLKILAKKDAKIAIKGKWFTPQLRIKFHCKTSYLDDAVTRPVAFQKKKWW